MKHAIFPTLLLLVAVPTAAAEGMWQPDQIPGLAPELERLGLELDPASMTRLDGHPMGAVISLGGCSASFVSPDGLVVTNHHCIDGSLQYNSRPERNLMTDGFLARTREEELPATPGSRVFVTAGITDVTDRVLEGLAPETGGLERYRTIESNGKRIVRECERRPGYRCRVSSSYGGLRYLRTQRMEIRDVRLVYAPPGSIGNFGGDVDNWMWPRHTGDFGFYRAYVGKDGQPADYSPDNVPFRPRHHLRIATSGTAEDELVMVMGYPYRTRRHVTAREVANAFGWYYPSRRALLEAYLNAVETATADRPGAAIRYASSVSGLNNSIKNYAGQMEGFTRTGGLERKEARESEMRAWVESGPLDGERFREALAELDAVLVREERYQEADLVIGLMSRVQMLDSARDLYRCSRERRKPDADRAPGFQERDRKFFTARLRRVERRYDPEVDRAIWIALLEEYRALPKSRRLPALDAAVGLEKGPEAVAATLRTMYANTRLGDTEKRLDWMDKPPEAFEASDDPFIRLAVALYDDDIAREDREHEIEGDLKRLRPIYMEALIAFQESLGRPVYDDANGTLRVTYGTVLGYSPRDAVFHRPFTRVEGIAEKYDGKTPFDAPAALLEAVAKRDYGRYAFEPIGSVPVDFLSTVDTTGGNSGSPTVNGRGELVGLLFDGVYETINSDWDFDPRSTRSIHTDIRYVLWVMDRIDRAHELMREMGVEPESAP